MLDLAAQTVPDHCPVGHPWELDDPVVGWVACWCAPAQDGRHGHVTFRCRECGSVVLRPDHDGPTP